MQKRGILTWVGILIRVKTQISKVSMVGTVDIHGDRWRQGVRLGASICWSTRTSGSIIILQLLQGWFFLTPCLDGALPKETPEPAPPKLVPKLVPLCFRSFRPSSEAQVRFNRIGTSELASELDPGQGKARPGYGQKSMHEYTFNILQLRKRRGGRIFEMAQDKEFGGFNLSDKGFILASQLL